MACHEPGHRAPARCASALLAAGVLLATAAEELSGPPGRPASHAAATPGPAPARIAEAAVSRDLGRALLAPEARKRVTLKRPAAVKKSKKWKGSWKSGKHSRFAVHKRARKTGTVHRKPLAKPTKPSATKPLPSSFPPATNIQAATAVHEARSLLGIPYVWGGTTRAGFDCSGLTQHVWAAAGVKIPRTVRQQAAAGTPVPLNQAQPGDLVVFYPTRHHVGLYVGDGYVVDAPHRGAVVRFDPIRSMPVSIVVRPHQ